MARFKQEILDKIKADVDLFALVAKALNIKPTTLSSTIDRNGNKLNQYNVVKLVADYLNKKPEQLLEKETVQG